MEEHAFDIEYTVKVPVTKEDVTDIVVTAIEGGIGYWACLDNTGAEFASAPEDEAVSETTAKLLLGGKEVTFCDTEDEGEIWTLSLDKLKNGLRLFAEGGYDHYHAFTSTGIDMSYLDAEMADIVFQLALFEEVVYG